MPSLRDFITTKDYSYDARTNATGANDFYNTVVQFDDNPNAVASAEATLLFSGPPIYKKPDDYASKLIPIGTVQGISDGGSPNIVPYREVGSKIKRFAKGSADYQISLSKVLTWHSSILHAFYAWLHGKTLTMMQQPGNDTDPENPGGTLGSHYFNLDSDLFGVPFGLALITVTADGRILSKEYWEKCLIQSLGKQISAGQPLIQEQVQLFITRKVAADSLSLTDATGHDFVLRKGNGEPPANPLV